MKLTLGSSCMLLLALCYLVQEAESIDYSQPISPKNYSHLIGRGLALSFFAKPRSYRKYNEQCLDDVSDAGFENVRIRCSAYPFPDSPDFPTFLDRLDAMVDKSLSLGLAPIISWADGLSRTYATEENRTNYLSWWQKVAKRMDSKDYRVSFNLFTELGTSLCRKRKEDCGGSLALNMTKYNTWTPQVVRRIRNTGGYNENRILIMGAPRHLAEDLDLIDKKIYENDNYMMAEHHLYASGPTHKPFKKFWTGNGTADQRQTLVDLLETARDKIQLETYFGAWMPYDNIDGSINQFEAESFSEHFVTTLKKAGIPWSLNAIDVYYNTRDNSWKTGIQNISNALLNVSSILDVIKENM